MQQPSVSPRELKRFSPLRNLPSRVLSYVASQAQRRLLTAETRLQLPPEPDGMACFLLRGELASDPEQGNSPVSAGSLASRQPLVTAGGLRASGDVELLLLPRDLYSAITQLPTAKQRGDRPQFELQEPDALEDRIYWQLHEQIEAGRLQLPSLPDIALRIAKTVNNPTTDSADIARVIQADPGVAARLISVVNSAAYRGRAPIDNLQDAVTRLGHDVTHNLVISFALGSLFRSRSPLLQRKMAALWSHACHVAPICHELARVTPGLDPDKALLCGLVHDIGALPVINAARSHPAIGTDPELLERLLRRLKGELGGLVLRKWQFGEDFVQAALHAEDWMQDIDDRPDYVDLLLVAQLHAAIGRPEMAQLPRIDLLPAFHKLALGRLTPRHSIGILENSRAQIEALRGLLLAD